MNLKIKLLVQIHAAKNSGIPRPENLAALRDGLG